MTIDASALTDPHATPYRVDGYAPIGDYAAIGDGRTIALVARDGCIDWLCLPRIDCSPVFDAALDSARGGRFSLEPAIPYTAERRYLERSNVLETEFRTADGVVRVTDALTSELLHQRPWRELVRRVECAGGGPVPMRWRFAPRFDYGRRPAELERRDGAFAASDGSLHLVLQQWDAGEPEIEAGAATATFEAQAGSVALLALTAAETGPVPRPGRGVLERRLENTTAAWRSWLAGHSYDGPWAAAVERSLLALKLLADPRTGALAAAGTMSLPEVIGGKRNFDYRFGWVRDSAFAMDALMRVGMDEMATASLSWLLDAAGHTLPRLNPVYRIDGRPLKRQEQLPLAGYRGSEPVLAGNQAGTQRQLGSWGDFVETAFLFVQHGHLLAPSASARLADCADLLTRIWRREDAGLWEVSDADYATSKMSCWVVFDRLVRLAEQGLAPRHHLDRWRETRAEIREYVDTRLWSDEKRSYVQKTGSDALDAGCLLASRRGFGDPGGERMRGTIEAVRSELSAGGPLLYRYSGMQEKENAFLACSFWLVEALARAHRLDEAAEIMEQLLGLATDVGLYSEEIEPGDKQMRGNMPQALTHLSLLNAAALFADAQGRASGERSR